MKLSNYLVRYLHNQSITHVFVLIGGACAHIIDSIGASKNINYICFQHEQAAVIAADAYARLTNNFGVSVVTSGPGATNSITGVACSWFDSVPLMLVSGQVNLSQTKGKKKIRQLGFQETDIVKIVQPITKFAAMVKKPSQIKYFLDKGLYAAKSGRPGPVWLDIPLNIQHAKINPLKLKSYHPIEKRTNNDLVKVNIKECLKLINSAKKPLILAGFGIRIAKATDEFKQLVKTLNWPVVSTWSAKDILPYNHKQSIGTIGVYGVRAANFAVQNCDLLLSIGSRLDTRQTGSNPKTFARKAKKIIVDIDKAELTKSWIKADLAINSDAKDFLIEMNKQLPNFKMEKPVNWLAQCRDWQKNYPIVLPYYKKQKYFVNPYFFIEMLSEELAGNSIIVCDIGAITAWVMQALRIKEGQRLISALGCGPMGYALPASIGACFAQKDKQIICLTGDGGMQVNIQELQTVSHYRLPIKIFVFNNQSYGIIKQFQDTYFNSRYEASEKGYSTPDFIKVSKAYGLATALINNHYQLREKIRLVLRKKGSVLCDLEISPDQKILPKLESIKTKGNRYISKPIDDQWPYLTRNKFQKNVIINRNPF